MKKSTLLRKLIAGSDPLVAPGAFDGLTTKLVEQAGFSAVYASGGAMARAAGYPDIGLMTLNEVADRLRIMTEISSLPIIADADTGFGSAVNARRTAKIFEQIGVAGFHIEDQEFPKRCGHLDNKGLISSKEMCHKIEAVKNALDDENTLVIARTDAIAVEGFEQAVSRAKEYVQAGADMIFVEAPTSIEQIEKVARAVPGPKLMNMFYGGKTPLVPKNRLKELGYNLIIIPSDLQRAAIKAVQLALKTIALNGDSSSISDQLATFQEREEIIQTKDFLKFEYNGG